MISELPDSWQGILAAIVVAKAPWLSPEEVASAISFEVDQVTDWLADMNAAGWIDVWEQEDAPLVVTLSPLAAERLDVHLVEVGEEQFRWALRQAPEPLPPIAVGVMADAAAADMAWVADTAPSAEELVAEADELEAAAKKPKKKKKPKVPKLKRLPQFARKPLPRILITGGLPWPTVLLGVRLWDWKELAPGVPACYCPSCHGRKLRSWEYCLVCDRWGFNQFRAPGPPELRRRPKRKPTLEWIKHIAKLRRRREKEERRAKRGRRSA